uniref:THAP-type domain-containing protein n=1 Tax=Wuchereria bancrofti TaxID=6293 RepID=A0A1I8ETG5_WUCBA
MEKCIFCGWYRRTNGPTLRFYGIPREPGLKRVKWLCAIGDRELSPKDKVCSIHFRQGRPSNDPSHEDFAPHLFLQRLTTQPVAKTLTYLESLANDDDFDEMPSVSRPERIERLHACKPSILRKRRKVVSPSDEPKKIDQGATENPQDCSSEKTLLSETQEVEKKSLKDDMPNIVMFTNPVTGMKKRMKLQHLPRPFVEAVGIKPGQTVIIKRRIRVAKSARNQIEGSDTMENVLEKEENLLENAANIC